MTFFRDQIQESDAVERCWSFGGCTALGDGKVSSASRVAEAGLDAGAIHGWIDCNPGPCPAGSGPNAFSIHRADFTLADRTDPWFTSTPSGDLLDTSKPLFGARAASFSAQDKGGGLYAATLEVDGKPMVTQVIDDNGGRCRKPFGAAVPCRLAASGGIALDTAALPDGAHRIRLLVSDATETNVAIYGLVEIRTANHGAPGTPGTPGGPGTPPSPGADDRWAVQVRTVWAFRGRRTRVLALTPTGVPADAKITLRCRGRGCPFKRRAVRTRGRAKVALIRYLRRARLRPGARLSVLVSRPGLGARRFESRIRTRRLPVGRLRCTNAAGARIRCPGS